MRPLPALLALMLCPLLAVAAPVVVRTTPGRVLLGRDSRVLLEVRVPEGTGPVRAAASSGGFAREVVAGGAVRTFEWTPPEVRYPLAAVLLFWVEGASGQPPEVTRHVVPLLGTKELDISTQAGAEVVVEVQGTRFGPQQADGRGRVRVPVEVPPGVQQARVLASRGSFQTDRTTPLGAPPFQPLVAALGPDPLPDRGEGWLVVAGEPSVDAQALRWTSPNARLEPVEGTALATFRVQPRAGARRVSVEVRRSKAPDAASASAVVHFAGPRRVEPLASPWAPPPPVLWEEPPPRPEGSGPLGLHLLAGGFFAGGANAGPAAALGASYRLPVWGERLDAELEVGVRQASFEAPVEGFGVLRSRVLAGPVLASARVAGPSWGALSLHGRAGGGLMPLGHELSSDFQASQQERQQVPMAFLAAQGAWRLGALSALLELRAAYAAVRTPLLQAQLGGVSLALGVRYVP